MPTTTEQTKAVIRRFWEAWNSRQPDAFDGLVAQDVTSTRQPAADLTCHPIAQFAVHIEQCDLDP
jgi:ketosteroid isomerase-like protein